MITLYGIPNCTTVKKARVWLTEHQVAHEFHDFKKVGVPPAALEHWLGSVAWERLLNRKGTTWRGLPAELQAGVTDAASAQAVMLAHPSVIKRPVVDWGAEVTVGFDADEWAGRL